MSSIIVTHRKSKRLIIPGHFDIFARASDGSGTFKGLGHTHGMTTISWTPSEIETDHTFHGPVMEVRITATLVQTTGEDLLILRHLSRKNALDIVFFDEAFSENNFVIRDVSLMVSGGSPISRKDARAIPVSMVGYVFDIARLFEKTTQEVCVPFEYLAIHHTEILAGHAWDYSDIVSYASQDALSSQGAILDGYYKEQDVWTTPFGFDASMINFNLTASVHIASDTLTTREIGLCLATKDSVDAADTGFAYFVCVNGNKLRIHEVDREAATVTFKQQFGIGGDSTTEIRLEVRGDVMTIYENDTISVGSYTMPHSHADGWMIGAVVMTGDGVVTSANHLLGGLCIGADMVAPKWLYGDDLDVFTDDWIPGDEMEDFEEELPA